MSRAQDAKRKRKNAGSVAEERGAKTVLEPSGKVLGTSWAVLRRTRRAMQKTHSTHGGSAFAQSVTKYYPQHGLKGSIYRRKPSACYAKSISRRLTNRKQRKREKKRKSSVEQQAREKHVAIAEKRNMKRNTQQENGVMLVTVSVVFVHGIHVP